MAKIANDPNALQCSVGCPQPLVTNTRLVTGHRVAHRDLGYFRLLDPPSQKSNPFEIRPQHGNLSGEVSDRGLLNWNLVTSASES